MKKYYLYIALAIVALMTASCRNNKKSSTVDAAVEAAEIVLSEDILTAIDDLANEFVNESGRIDIPSAMDASLTEEEKLIKPDFLLEPRIINSLVTKTQKVYALAALVCEYPVRKTYGLPLDIAEESIARLGAELNHTPSINDFSTTPAEKIKEEYELCKERGEIDYFWKFTLACETEVLYLISKNPDAFFRNITEEQYAAFAKRYEVCDKAARLLSEYDEELAEAIETLDGYKITNADEESEFPNTIESAKRMFEEGRESHEARRAELMKRLGA